MRYPVTIPNGMSWSLDKKTMYFTHSTEHTVYGYDFDAATGNISHERVFWRLGSSGEPDGQSMDRDGFLWQAIYGEGRVLRVSPEGKVVGEITLPTRNVTCPTFVGEDLFITSAAEDDPKNHPESAKFGGALFRVNVGITGVPNNKFKLGRH
jgi:sugar lactone lactonase YvrE